MMATTTAPKLSGQFRVSNAQGFKSGFARNPLIIAKTCNAGEDEHEQYSGLVKPENYSGSFEHYHYSGLTEHKHSLGSLVIQKECTYQNQQVKCNEKGRTANPTLWGVYSSNYESFVVLISTYKNFVGQSAGDSLAFFRCLRLISPCSAATTNCPVLSLSSLSVSTASATSWGTRTSKRLDLALMPLVAMVFSIVTWCPTSYSIQIVIESIDVSDTVVLLCVRHLVAMILVSAKPSSATNTCQASIHNVTKAYTMEYLHSTQTRPEKKYLWRFLALNRSDMGSKPCRISVEAPTEHEARRVLAPFFILSLSARLSAQGVCNV
jgi:hypothetical protein